MAKDKATTERAQHSNGRLTYDFLLDAAVAIWSEEGIDGVTMNAVAKRAGRTRGTVYHHFTDRADLIVAMHQHLDDRLSNLFNLTKFQSRNDYMVTAGITVDSPEILRSYFLRLLSTDLETDKFMAAARQHYREVQSLDLLQPGIDADQAAVITLGLLFASMLAVELQTTPSQRRAEARNFAESFQHVMESSVLSEPLKIPASKISASEPPRNLRRKKT